MIRNRWTIIRALAWFGLIGSGSAQIWSPEEAPVWVLGTLLVSSLPMVRGFQLARGTALRPPLVWGLIALVLGVVAQLVATGEPLADGRPWAGHGAYLMSLSALAALISVLNARRPGSGPWAGLMALLVLVFLIPWLEGSGLVGSGDAMDRLRLESPWNLFFALLILAGAVNYLLTRYGLAAFLVGVGLGLEWLALVATAWPPIWRGRLWSLVPWCLALAVWVAEAIAARPAHAKTDLDRLWLWFRDRWGLVWALRVMERFNREARVARWPIRLEWPGVVSTSSQSDSGDLPEPMIPENALATLRGLLRRFADRERLDEAARDRPRSPSPSTLK